MSSGQYKYDGFFGMENNFFYNTFGFIERLSGHTLRNAVNQNRFIFLFGHRGNSSNIISFSMDTYRFNLIIHMNLYSESFIFLFSLFFLFFFSIFFYIEIFPFNFLFIFDYVIRSRNL